MIWIDKQLLLLELQQQDHVCLHVYLLVGFNQEAPLLGPDFSRILLAVNMGLPTHKQLEHRLDNDTFDIIS